MASRPGVTSVKRDEVFDIKVFCRRGKGFDLKIRSLSSQMYINGNKFSCSSLDLKEKVQPFNM